MFCSQRKIHSKRKIKMFGSLAVLLGVACFVQAAITNEAPNEICRERNIYYPIEGSCDSFVECEDFQAKEMLCPDGLHFNPRAIHPENPCAYPSDVSCEGRGSPQPAKPTAECPHQFGLFPSHTSHCDQFRVCVAGVAFEMACSAGLAFNPEALRCDWPDLVPTCNTEEFLGFRCPDSLQDQVVNYKYEGDCYSFFSCKNGRARLLSCEGGFAYDERAGACVPEQEAGCTQKQN